MKNKAVTIVAFVAFSTGSLFFPISIIIFQTGVSPSFSQLGPLGFSAGLIVFQFLYAVSLLLTFVGILYMGRKVSPNC